MLKTTTHIRQLALLWLLWLPLCLMAQNDVDATGLSPKEAAGRDTTRFVPMVKVSKTLVDGDSIKYVEMTGVYVYAPMQFKNEKQRQAFNRLVNNVKKTLPIAKEVNRALIETYEYMETLPNEKARQEHIKMVEKGIKAQYTPRMKKLTLSQGKLLIKLVHRETNSSGYELVQAFLGSTRAAFYQSFAWLFGASLKKEYEPNGRDRMTERVVRLVEAGQL